jgi:hypothetical protein
MSEVGSRKTEAIILRSTVFGLRTSDFGLNQDNLFR